MFYDHDCQVFHEDDNSDYLVFYDLNDYDYQMFLACDS